MAEATSMDIFQLKITLKGGHKPPIWRRIQILKDSTFKELHHAIQCSMGWGSIYFDYHLHIFRSPPSKNPFDKRDYEIAKIFYDCGSEEEDGYCSIECNGITLHAGRKKVDETKIKLCDYFKAPKDIIEYEYDFARSWQHLIVLEKILPSVAGKVYPLCVAGKRACPPEDGCPSDSDDDWETRVFDPKSVEFPEVPESEEEED